MESIHDNKIISYEVNLEKKRIVFHTLSPDSENKLNIIFTNVIAHVFEDELFRSIILDIEKADLNRFLSSNKKLLQEKKDYLWPMVYETENELYETLDEKGITYYVIYSSYGLNGWILAESMSIEVDV